MSPRLTVANLWQVVPLVFGFPSPALRQFMARDTLVLGGDYLADGDDPAAAACWTCLNCRVRYTRYPHSPEPVGLQTPSGNQSSSA
eukprot:scaffold227726_cov44-Prasinocladus_malaysianus.AAC.1